ncbi:MAG: DUF6265 family protein [Planctomycetota bacterium]
MHTAIRRATLSGFALTICVLLAFPTPSRAQRDAEPAFTIDDCAWLAGAYRGEDDGVVFEEHWMLPAAGTMIGMYRVHRDDRLLLTEHLMLEEEDDGITLTIRLYRSGTQDAGPGSVRFRLIAADNAALRFERDVEEGAYAIEYTKWGEGIAASLLSRRMKPDGTPAEATTLVKMQRL